MKTPWDLWISVSTHSECWGCCSVTTTSCILLLFIIRFYYFCRQLELDWLKKLTSCRCNTNDYFLRVSLKLVQQFIFCYAHTNKGRPIITLLPLVVEQQVFFLWFKKKVFCCSCTTFSVKTFSLWSAKLDTWTSQISIVFQVLHF